MAGAVIRPEKDLTVKPLYEERAGIGALDTVGDFAFFLGAIDQAAAVYGVYAANDFDFNNVQYDADLNPVFRPNAMPDAAELYLVERVVKMGRTGLIKRSGIASGLTWQAWSTNFAQAQLDLPGEDIRVHRTVAGYMTVGNYDTIRLIEHLVRVSFGVELTEAAYDREQQTFLKADEDADNDGVTNISEWQTASPDGSLANLPAFGDAALDGHKPVPLGTASAFGAQALPLFALGTGGCDCENADCMAMGEVAAWAYPDLDDSYPFLASEPWFVGATNIATATPDGTALPLGSEITTMAFPDSSQGFEFSAWQAAGTLLDGSRETTDTFVLTEAGVTRPLAKFGLTRLQLPQDASDWCTITATPTDKGTEEITAEKRFVYLPPQGLVTLKAKPANRRQKIYGWVYKGGPNFANPRYTHTKAVTVPAGGYAEPLLTDADAEPMATTQVTLSTSEGGMVLGSEAIDWNGVFAKIVSLPDHASTLCLSAIPEPGYEFDHWISPNRPGTSQSVLTGVSVDEIQTAKAAFKKKEEFELEVKTKLSDDSKGGSAKCAGSIVVSPARKYYRSTDTVTLMPQCQPGYVFVKWEGDGVDAAGNVIDEVVPEYNPFLGGYWLQVNMTATRTVRAVFRYEPIQMYQCQLTRNDLSLWLTGQNALLNGDEPVSLKIVDSEEDKNNDGIADNVAFITPGPSMPNLSAHIASMNNIGTSTWLLSTEYRHAYKNIVRDDSGYCEATGPGEPHILELPGGGPFMPNWDLHFFSIHPNGEKLSIAGGDAKLDASYCLLPIDSFNFKILGINPPDNAARFAIAAAYPSAPEDTFPGDGYMTGRNANEAFKVHYMIAIARHEGGAQGGNYFNQFNVNNSLKGKPNFGQPDGWGLMQVDNGGKAMSADVRWNWRVNIEASVPKVQYCKEVTDRFFEAIKTKWGAMNGWRSTHNMNKWIWEDPPSYEIPDSGGTVVSAKVANTITTYNSPPKWGVCKKDDENHIVHLFVTKTEADKMGCKITRGEI